jgi:hypothetical protein
MKKLVFYVLFFSQLIPCTQAQIRLIGVNNTNTSDKIDIVTWNAFDSSSVSYYQTDLNSYAFASSGFSDYSGQYYLSGFSAAGKGRLSFNTYTNNSTFAAGVFLSNITEFDMSTGIMYSLSIDVNNKVSVIANSLSSNQDSLVGTFVEPNLRGLLADAICFDANKGIIYHIGMNPNNSKDLYAIYVRDTNFTYTKTPILDQNSNNLTALQFDNVNNKLYCRRANFDSISTYLGSDIVEINSLTGAVSLKMAITQFPYFVASSSCYDQNTGTFLIIGIDDNYISKMIAYNTLTDSLVIGYVPRNVSELACVNTQFAQVKYGTPTVVKKVNQAELISMYPNPAADKLYIKLSPNGLENNLQFELINMMGETVYQNKLDQVQTEFQISALKPGIYFYKIMDKTQSIHTGKLSKE